MDEDRIKPAFTGRNLLITGGSGFLGKVLIEKFLRYEFVVILVFKNFSKFFFQDIAKCGNHLPVGPN
jgi:FlaA1/EpsC-like NDP-sugar epimerase